MMVGGNQYLVPVLVAGLFAASGSASRMVGEALMTYSER